MADYDERLKDAAEAMADIMLAVLMENPDATPEDVADAIHAGFGITDEVTR